MNKTKQHLLETIQLQEELIRKQAETIFSLVNENMEQENLINVMMREHVD